MKTPLDCEAFKTIIPDIIGQGNIVLNSLCNLPGFFRRGPFSVTRNGVALDLQCLAVLNGHVGIAGQEHPRGQAGGPIMGPPDGRIIDPGRAHGGLHAKPRAPDWPRDL